MNIINLVTLTSHHRIARSALDQLARSGLVHSDKSARAFNKTQRRACHARDRACAQVNSQQHTHTHTHSTSRLRPPPRVHTHTYTHMNIPHHKRMARAHSHTSGSHARVPLLVAALPPLSTCQPASQPASRPGSVANVTPYRADCVRVCSPETCRDRVAGLTTTRTIRFRRSFAVFVCVCVYSRVREWSANSILRGRPCVLCV